MDGEAPEGEISVSGIDKSGFSNNSAAAALTYAEDKESGIRTVQARLIKMKTGVQSEETAEEGSGGWTDWGVGQSWSIQGDGTYSLSVRMTDRVGNTSIIKSPAFTIDTAAPRIEISGLMDGVSYNGGAAARVTVRDLNILEEDIDITLSRMGKIMSEKSLPVLMKRGNGSIEFILGNLPLEQYPDGNYELAVTATDRAGNRSDKSIHFTLNRNGSVYSLAKESGDRIARFYNRESFPIVLTETNLDSVQKTTITRSLEGELKVLENGSDYTVKTAGKNAGVRKYEYTINENCFEQEGIYEVVVASADRAGNKTDSQLQKMELVFAIDKTPPLIFVGSMGTTGKVRVEVRDAISLAGVEIIKNGRLWKSYTGEEWEVNGTEELSENLSLLNEEKTILKVQAWDKADNMASVSNTFEGYRIISKRRDTGIYAGGNNERSINGSLMKKEDKAPAPKEGNTGKADGGEAVSGQAEDAEVSYQNNIEQVGNEGKEDKRSVPGILWILIVLFGAAGSGALCVHFVKRMDFFNRL